MIMKAKCIIIIEFLEFEIIKNYITININIFVIVMTTLYSLLLFKII